MKGRAAKKPRRGAAAPDRQLGKTGRAFLAWLATREDNIKASGDRKRIKELNQKGVPWEPRRFYDETGWAKPKNVGATLLGVLNRLEKSPGKKGKPRHLVKAWDTLGNTGKERRISHVKLTPTGRETAEYELEHGKTPRQVNEAFWREVERKDELQRLRAKKEKMLDGFDELKSEMYEHDFCDPDIVQEVEDDIADVLERIVTLALLLDQPLTEDERSAVSLETPLYPLIKMPLAS
jgi:hypothetical protein